MTDEPNGEEYPAAVLEQFRQLVRDQQRAAMRAMVRARDIHLAHPDDEDLVDTLISLLRLRATGTDGQLNEAICAVCAAMGSEVPALPGASTGAQQVRADFLCKSALKTWKSAKNAQAVVDMLIADLGLVNRQFRNLTHATVVSHLRAVRVDGSVKLLSFLSDDVGLRWSEAAIRQAIKEG